MSHRKSAAEILSTRDARVEFCRIQAAQRIQDRIDQLERVASELPTWCPLCAARRRQSPTRRRGARQLRELVTITQQLARDARSNATLHAQRGCHETARIQRELAAAADAAIAALRIDQQEPWA